MIDWISVICLLVSSASLSLAAPNAKEGLVFRGIDFTQSSVEQPEYGKHFNEGDLPELPHNYFGAVGHHRSNLRTNMNRDTPAEDYAPLPPITEEPEVKHSISRLESAPLMSLCAEARRAKIQLSHCSAHYISCERESVFIRTCPFPGTVFVDGRCMEAKEVPACRDSEINLSNEDTRDLAESEKFCISRGSGVFRIRNGCQDQAIICDMNEAKTIVIGCSVGMTLTDTLDCQTSYQCHSGNFRSLREFFIHQVCSKHAYPPKNEYGTSSEHPYADLQPIEYSSSKCRTWYISCSPSGGGEIVRCENGFIAEGQRCRPIRPTDPCNSVGVCSGHEYESIGLGECQPEFIYCDGNREVQKRCEFSMVFYNGECKKRQDAGCEQCKEGDRVEGENCDQYLECDGKLWQKKTCEKNEGFDKYTKRCEKDYYCAKPVDDCDSGSAYVVSCEKYFVCENGEFVEKSCPYGTSYDVYKQQCTPNKGCVGYSENYANAPKSIESNYTESRKKRSTEMRQSECRQGDVTPSRDCQTFFFCDQGRFKKAKCEDANGHWSSACFDCNSLTHPDKGEMNDHHTHPAECKDGQYSMHPEKCDAYFECKDENWTMQKCPAGKLFSASIVDCDDPTEGVECGNSITLKCTEGERVVHEQRCDRLLECKNGEWIELECPRGFRYDAAMFRCEPGDCSGSAVMLPPHPQTTAPPPTTTSLAIQQTQRESVPVIQEKFIAQTCTGNFKLPDQHDCTRLWECNGRGYLISKPCPAEHYYEKSKKGCVKGYCDQELPSEDEPKTICEEGQAIPRETCGEYKLCQKGYWIDGVCDGNLAFVDNVCGPEKCEKDHIDPKYVTSAQCVHQALQTGSDEQSYRYCYYGNWVERKCPPDHIFNWQLLKCMPKEEEYQPYRPKCPPGTRKRFENSTDIYEECEEEMWVRKYCAYGQVFINGYCTVPVENPSYEKESHSKEEKPEYGEGNNDDHDDKDDKYDKDDKDGDYSKPVYHNPVTEYCVMSGGRDGYRRVPHDCSKFYQCVHGKWMEMPCAPGTFWNEAISVCDHIGNVPGCGQPGQKYI